MQDRHMDSILVNALGSAQGDWIPEYTEQIKRETTNLPTGMRTPTAQETADIAEFIRKYKKEHPRAGSRNIRRAAIRKFNVQILPTT